MWLEGRSASLLEGRWPMEVKDALLNSHVRQVHFGASYHEKEIDRPPKVTVYFDHHLAADCSLCSFIYLGLQLFQINTPAYKRLPHLSLGHLLQTLTFHITVLPKHSQVQS